VPGKNLRKLGGLSLTAFKAISAKKSKHCSRLVISSDSEEIQREAVEFGAEVLFNRPNELASDSASSEDVVRHALDFIKTNEGRTYDGVMLLEPSSPFAGPQDYDQAIDIYLREKASLVVGVRETEVNSVFTGPLGQNGNISGIIEKFTNLGDTRRQALATEYTMNGTLYLIDCKMFEQTGKVYGDPERTYGYVMDRAHSTEIETLFDLKLAEFLIDSGEIDISEWK